VRIIVEIGVGIALDDGQAVRDRSVDARLRQFDPASIDIPLLDQKTQEFARSATDIEHACARLDHVGDQKMVGALRHRRGCERVIRHYTSPLARAQPSRKPRTVAWNSGSSSRKASCPLSLAISTKDTLAALAFSACTTSRESVVGNSQSEVKLTRQKRVFVPA